MQTWNVFSTRKKEKIPCYGEFTQRSNPWAGLIASCGSFYPMVLASWLVDSMSKIQFLNSYFLANQQRKTSNYTFNITSLSFIEVLVSLVFKRKYCSTINPWIMKYLSLKLKNEILSMTSTAKSKVRFKELHSCFLFLVITCWFHRLKTSLERS